MNRLIAILFTLIIVSGCAPAKVGKPFGKSHSCEGFEKGAMGSRLSWAVLPIQLSVHPQFPKNHIVVLEEAIEEWNAELERPLFVYVGVDDGSEVVADGRNVIAWSKDPIADTMTQAQTHLQFVNGTIYEADMIIYEQNLGVDADGDTMDVDLKSLLKHELGHVLGLSHEKSEESLMQKHLPKKTEREISKLELDRVRCAYP